MSVIIDDIQALRSIPPQALRAYAQSEGWKELESYGKHSDVYAGESLPEIILPRSDQLTDYHSVVSVLI